MRTIEEISQEETLEGLLRDKIELLRSDPTTSLRDEAQAVLAMHAVRRSGSVPTRFRNAALDDFTGAIRGQIDSALSGLPDLIEIFERDCREQQYSSPNASMVLWQLPRLLESWTGPALTGPPGVGKSHLCWALRRELISRGIPCGVVSTVELALRLRESFDSNSRESAGDIVDSLVRQPILILDDIDKLKPSAFTMESLFNIVNQRYEACRPLILTSNMTPGELLAAFSNFGEFAPALVDRLRDLRWLALSGASRRGQRAA